ncbi:MAG: SCP2 sterol-binding domain-containing protein [Oscillospiraceae bacterium]|nr:SCP2 sterol-binding domain-containing protein [Oscillospiraceae bacterium]
MKEFNINGAVMKCYPLTAAQRMHFYTIKFSPPQVLCIGTGVYVKQELDFGKLKDCIFIVTANDFLKIMSGEMNPIWAFTTGKLKVQGSIEKALEFQKISDRVKSNSEKK